MTRHLVGMTDLKGDLKEILDKATAIKADWKAGKETPILKGQVLGMIFEKPSLRTRISFEVGMHELGGKALYISPSEISMGKRESVHDVAKVLSRYVDGIMYRAFDWRMVEELAKHAEVPVINGLDNREHPCQIVADLLTVKEHKGALAGRKLVWVGDGNNVCNSLMLGCAMTGMSMVAACPKGFEPDAGILAQAQKIAPGKISVQVDPFGAVKDADVIYTDTWVSMGEEAQKAAKEAALKDYQVNAKLVGLAKKDCIVMHCLPAHRGQEITDEVMDGPHSVVFDQAENRNHAQKGIMATLMAR